MADRDIREIIVKGWETRLAREPGVRGPYIHALALELAAIAEAHGLKFIRPAHFHDPNADWRQSPEPGDWAAGLKAARAEAGLPCECGCTRDDCICPQIADRLYECPCEPCPTCDTEFADNETGS